MKILILILAVVSLIMSIYWGVSQEAWLEPWTVSISALLFILSYFVPVAKEGKDNSIKQRSFFGLFNSSKIKKSKGKVEQSNFFGIGNKKEVDNS